MISLLNSSCVTGGISTRCVSTSVLYRCPLPGPARVRQSGTVASPHTFKHKSLWIWSWPEFPRGGRHKLQLNINPITERMQTACLKILTSRINFITNFVTLLLRKLVARADGESGPTASFWQTDHTMQASEVSVIHEKSVLQERDNHPFLFILWGKCTLQIGII